MIKFLKKYYIYLTIIFIVGLLIYNNYSRKLYPKFYKTEGLYTVGKIKEIKAYGRATGYNFVYKFRVNNKEYEARTDIGKLNIHEAETYEDKTFLVVSI